MLSALFLCGCSSQESESEESDTTEIAPSKEEIPETNETDIIEDLPTEEDFFLEDFPTEWVQLDLVGELDESFMIYHYCDAEVPFVSIEAQKGDEANIYTGWGQDGEVRTLQNFKAVKELGGDLQRVVGTFDVFRDYDGELKTVEFSWNLESHICEFVGLGFNSNYFIDKKHEQEVDHVEEDCKGYWEEQYER